MSRVIAYPYRRPLEGRISTTPWQLISGASEALLGEGLPHWDYNTPVHVTRTINLDIEGVRADCMLSKSDRLRIAVVWVSSGTNLRGAGSSLDLSNKDKNQSVQLQLKVAGQFLAHNIRIRTQLILADYGNAESRLAAKIPGSVLWLEEKNVLLEGVATRFPVESIDFGKSSWMPSGAGWFLDWDKDDLNQRMLGGPRVYINSLHSRIVKAVTASAPDREDQAIISAIYFDIGRTLIRGGLENDDFVADHLGYPDGTVGSVIRRLLTAIFPEMGPKGLRQMMDERSSEFDCLLQNNFHIFQYK